MIVVEDHPVSVQGATTAYHIAHLSDIHLRLDPSFSTEYQAVFDRTIRILSSMPSPMLIVVTGDFFHIKDRLSPVCVNLAVDFLKRLSSIGKVFLIMGNHDGILHHPHDSISSVLYERDLLDVTYLRESGVYRYKNILFIVNAVFDHHRHDWLRASETTREYDDDRVVYLFHGMVDSCSLDNGVRLPSPIKITTHFPYADAVLLGDIHRHQYLAPHIAYAGSLIAQNIGEIRYPHGFVHWSFPSTGTVVSRFVKVSNPYQKVRIDLLTGRVDGIVEFKTRRFSNLKILLEKLQKRGSIRSTQSILVFVRCGNDHHNNHGSGASTITIHDEQIRTFIHSFLHRDVSIRRVFPNPKPPRVALTSKNTMDSPVEKAGSSSRYSVITKYIHEYIQSHPRPVSSCKAGFYDRDDDNDEEMTREIMDAVMSSSSSGKDDELADAPSKGVDVRFISLRFSNLFGYGENNVLQFEGTMVAPQIRMVCGSNSVGKSSIIDILVFLLFHRITRYASGNKLPKELIHEKRDTAVATLEFQHGVDHYEITKRLRRHHPVEMLLRRNGQNLTQSVRHVTEKMIRSIFGSYETFLEHSVCLQKSHKLGFKEKSPKDQKEYLYHLFQLEGFEKAYTRFHNEQSKHETVLQELRGRAGVLRETLSRQSLLFDGDDNALCRRRAEMEERQKRMDELTVQWDKTREAAMQSQYLAAEIQRLQSEYDHKYAEWEHHHQSIPDDDEYSTSPVLGHVLSKTLQETLLGLDAQLASMQRQLSSSLSAFCDDDVLRFRYDVYHKSSTRRRPRNDHPHKKDDGSIRNQASLRPSLSYPDHYNTVVRVIERYSTLLGVLESEDVRAKETRYRALEIEESALRTKLDLVMQQYAHFSRASYNENCECCIQNPFRHEQLSCRQQRIELEHEAERLDRMMQEVAVSFAGILSREMGMIDEDGYIIDDGVGIINITNLESRRRQVSVLKTEWEDRQTRLDSEYIEYSRRILHRLGAVVIKGYLERRMGVVKLERDRVRKRWEVARAREMRLSELPVILDRLRSQLDSVRLEMENKMTTLEEAGRIQGLLEDERRAWAVCQKNFLVQSVAVEEERATRRELETTTRQIQTMAAKRDRCEFMARLCHHQDGLPLFILRQKLVVLEREINTVLSNFLDRRVRFYVNQENQLVFQTMSTAASSSSTGLNVYGGMESFMLDIILKIVFSKFAPTSRPSLFILDENISVMDEERLQNVDSLLGFLRCYFSDILIISHQSFLMDVTDGLVRIVKDHDGFSKIVT